MAALVLFASACTAPRVKRTYPESAATACSRRGQPSAAIRNPGEETAYYARAVKRDRALSQPDTVALIGDLVGYSQALHDARDVSGADSVAHEALDLAMVVRGGGGAAAARVLTALAEYARTENRLLAAESLATRALVIDSTHQVVDDENVLTRTILGRVSGLQLRDVRGDSVYRRAFAVWRERCDTLSPVFARALTSYAEFLWWRGTRWWDRADSAADRAQAILAAGPIDSEAVAFNMQVRSELRHERHADRDADSLAAGAFDIAERIFGARSARVADYALVASVARYARGDSAAGERLYVLSKELAIPTQ